MRSLTLRLNLEETIHSWVVDCEMCWRQSDKAPISGFIFASGSWEAAVKVECFDHEPWLNINMNLQMVFGQGAHWYPSLLPLAKDSCSRLRMSGDFISWLLNFHFSGGIGRGLKRAGQNPMHSSGSRPWTFGCKWFKRVRHQTFFCHRMLHSVLGSNIFNFNFACVSSQDVPSRIDKKRRSS